MEGEEKEDRMLLVSEVAQRLRVSKDAAYAMIRRGEIPHIRVGRLVRVSPDALDRWIEEQHEAFSKAP